MWFLHFDLGKCFHATATCNFSTSNLPKVVRTWCGFCILTWESAFTPQQRAIFWHLIFQKWFEHGVVSAFWRGKMLSRHSNVQFFDIWFSKSGSNMVFCGFCLGAFASQRRHPLLLRPYFSTLLFGDFLNIPHTCIFCLLTSPSLLCCFFSTLLFSVFHLSILLEVWFLNLLWW